MKAECDNCGHAPHQVGMQWVMIGECEHCPECTAAHERWQADRKVPQVQS